MRFPRVEVLAVAATVLSVLALVWLLSTLGACGTEGVKREGYRPLQVLTGTHTPAQR